MARRFAWAGLALLVGVGLVLTLTHRIKNTSPEPEPMKLPGLAPHAPELNARLRAALAAQPEGYVPRTEHVETDGAAKYLNRLILESSPYLLQHAHNPVNWFPWGEEAFAEARRLDRPIFLSVGYATCHWCHVMERESFEDEEIAAYLNAHFVAVKVDREERPDVDQVYMTAVQLLSGGGGWPMTVLMNPDGEPFFAGTYFPARDGERGARVGFFTLLRRFAQLWDTERATLQTDARRLSEAVATANQPEPPEAMSSDAALYKAARFLARMYDPKFGGFSGAPKFPRPSVLELLLRYHRRSRDPLAAEMVIQTLEHMSNGGIYDHVGGGFARYSTDARWLVPHFEKMLYDNAQIMSALADTLKVATSTAGTAAETLERTLRETVRYTLREMTADDGCFYSATDADSEGVEGKFFVWSREEILNALGDDGPAFTALFDVTTEGNFEEKNILHRPRPRAEVAAELGMSEAQLEALATRSKARLYDLRKARIPPLLDDKILTEWNAQMIGALAKAGFVLEAPEALAAAERCAEVLLERHRTEDGLIRAWRQGRPSGRAVLEDYAFLVHGLLDLFEVTGAPRWLGASVDIAEDMSQRFWDAEGGGWFSADTEDLLVRDKPYYDGAQPSGNSVAALASLRLHALTQNPVHLERADRTLLAFGQLLDNGAVQTPMLATALDWRRDRAKEIVLVRGEGEAALLEVLRTTYVPNAVRVLLDPEHREALEARVPWLEGKVAPEGRATAYVCIEGACKRPTSDSEELRAQLEPERPLSFPPLKVHPAKRARMEAGH